MIDFTMCKDWINIHRPLFRASVETHIQENNTNMILRAVPAGWNFFGNHDHHTSGRIMVVGTFLYQFLYIALLLKQ